MKVQDRIFRIWTLVVKFGFESPKFGLWWLNLDFGSPNPGSNVQNLDFDGERIKINNVDILGLINKSSYSNSIRKTLAAIYDHFFDEEFSRADIVSYLSASKSASSNYISYLQDLNVIEQVKGKGKGKYRFK